MSLNSTQINHRDGQQMGVNMMTYNPAALGLEDMDFWHPPLNPAPATVWPVQFFVSIRGHLFLATPPTQDSEWIVRRVIDGERQDFVIGTFAVPADEAPEVHFLDNLWERVLAVADDDPESWRNAWTAEQIEQAEYDAFH